VSDHPILVLNAGSSSLKLSLYDGETVLCRGLADRIGLDAPHVKIKSGTGDVLTEQTLSGSDHQAVLDWLLNWCNSFLGGRTLRAVGHRVVHGADQFTAPTRVTPDIIEKLASLIPLAPLHQPHNVAPIRYLAQRLPELPQVACFDTAFHATQPEIARRFPLPRRYHDQGIKRYGFHGLSYEYIASRLPEIDARLAPGRIIVCHLGNGASLCAMLDCKSLATTMGFTALDGLMMGTRTGAIDPGVLLHLLQHEHLSPDQLSDLLYKQSGLLGVSGISSDMRDLLSSDSTEAREAVELFCYRIVREIGSLAVALHGLDALVFTGGIGENAAPIRERVCSQLGWLKATVLVIPTDEERMIARHTTRLVPR